MNHPGLVKRLVSELAAARAAIAASYQRLWPAAERTLRAPETRDPGGGPQPGAASPGDDDARCER